MKKRLLSMLLAMICVFSAMAPASAAGYEAIELKSGWSHGMQYVSTNVIYGYYAEIYINAQDSWEDVAWYLYDENYNIIRSGIVGSNFPYAPYYTEDLIGTSGTGYILELQCMSYASCDATAWINVSGDRG